MHQKSVGFQTYRKLSYPNPPMQCLLCGHPKTHKQNTTSKGSQRYRCSHCQQTFSETFDTLYYRRQISSQTIQTILQSHAEGSSLKGLSRITGVAYNPCMSVVRSASHKAQMIHNQGVQAVSTDVINADALWSFVKKRKNRDGVSVSFLLFSIDWNRR